MGFAYALVLVASTVLASSCAAATDGSNETGGISSEVRGEDRTLPTTASPSVIMSSPTPTDSSDTEPPGSTLSYGGKTVTGVLGSFCWQAKGLALCEDGAFIIDNWSRKKTLVAPSGAALTFAYGGQELDSLEVSVNSADGGDQRTKGLRTRPSGTRARIVADLPAGEYVVEAFATMPEGDAVYGFGLVVEG